MNIPLTLAHTAVHELPSPSSSPSFVGGRTYFLPIREGTPGGLEGYMTHRWSRNPGCTPLLLTFFTGLLDDTQKGALIIFFLSSLFSSQGGPFTLLSSKSTSSKLRSKLPFVLSELDHLACRLPSIQDSGPSSTLTGGVTSTLLWNYLVLTQSDLRSIRIIALFPPKCTYLQLVPRARADYTHTIKGLLPFTLMAFLEDRTAPTTTTTTLSPSPVTFTTTSPLTHLPTFCPSAL